MQRAWSICSGCCEPYQTGTSCACTGAAPAPSPAAHSPGATPRNQLLSGSRRPPTLTLVGIAGILGMLIAFLSQIS